MIGLIWNCQGLRKDSKFEFLKELIREEKVDFNLLVYKKLIGNNLVTLGWLRLAAKLFAWFYSPPNGKSRGILVGFNSEVFDVREHEPGEFIIRTLVLHRKKIFIWNFINVYGAAQNDNKSKFLCELSSFCSRSQYPLLIEGDFNIIRKSEEKTNVEVLSLISMI
jgi:hypothetical protein